MLAKGAGAMSNAELLAILIGSGTKKENVLEVANRLLAAGEGRLSKIASMASSEVMAMDGMVHNHPSGNPRPGREDLVQTGKMKKAAATFDISLLDHIIICDDMFYSFSDDRVYVSGPEGKNLQDRK